ncbi:EF-hand domain-containing protein [Novosphingobium beihaiensis]|uniref:EF-hand domain-containing protein n=1 Tax=Novosphingobium beihaiensis TaxID=2930389 RepID=A0ABT0BV54_9SPHN|nr:EF-hand domain-containing protein [Novosphingobium beihaiensis]MCJ2188887.1 EF-hand domain-containing protein [Novosphingobium beihaiensis]
MKTAIKTLTLGLSAAALSIGGIAYAQPPGPAKPFMDANKDGLITRDEAQKAAEGMFTRLDFNKDGKIDQADRDARHAQRRGAMFAKIDTNGDGSISKDEFMAAKAPGPRGPGMKGPGMTGQGMTAQGMTGPGMANPGKKMSRWGGKGKRGHHGRHGHGMMMLKMADTNNDGAVSKAEFMTASTKHFDMMDANKDGQVTKEERQTARQNMRAKWQAAQPAKK